MVTQSLQIEIVPCKSVTVLTINGHRYILEYTEITTPERLRDVLADEPEYVYNTVIEMFKEMADV